MASTKGRKPPVVVVRRPPEMPGLDVLDPSATAAFVDGKPMEVPKAPVPQAIDAPSHQRPEAPVLQGMEPSTSLDPSPAPVPGAPAESEAAADESTDASVTTGIGASRTRSTKASKHQGTRTPKAPAKGRGLVERAGGKAARRVVAYLDPAIAKKLAIRALHEDTDMSALINEAVRRFMAD